MPAPVLETIRVVVTGANPRTFSIQVSIDPSTGGVVGGGAINVPLTGTNVGTDTITCFMDSHSYVSNPASVAWWGAPTILAVPSVEEIPMPILQAGVGGHPQPGDPLPPGNIVTVYYNDIHDRSGPDQSLINAFNSATGAYVYLSQGSLPSQYQGIFKITAYGDDKPYHDTQDTHNWFQFICGGSPQGLYAEYGSAQYQQAVISTVVSPAPGTAGTAQLRLSPTGGIVGWTYPQQATGQGGFQGTQNWRLQGTSYTLSLTIQNVTYATKPYIPLLEGVQGTLRITNDPSGVAPFSFPAYNGSQPDRPTAASLVFGLSGDNNSWQGRLSITSPGADFLLAYNGASFDPSVVNTQLSIIADDVAWYNNTNKSFDLFQYSTQGGGVAYLIEVDYLVRPAIASVTPTSILANGANAVITFNLTKPLPPLQAATNFSVTFTGQQPATIGAVAPITWDGFITGFTLTVKTPTLVNSATAVPNVSASGTITYLNGTGFTTGVVNYLVNVPADTITWTGQSLGPAPVHYAWATNPAASGNPPVLDVLSSTSITLTATFYSRSNNILNCKFYKQNKTTNVRTQLGPTQTGFASSTQTIGGSTAYVAVFTLAITAAQLDQFSTGGDLLGYTGSDTDGQTETFFDTATYGFFTSGGGGGGGGGGCPALEMYVDEWHQVSDAFVGMGLDALEGETQEYLTTVPKSGVAQVQSIDFSTELCFHFVAKNGAEIVISGSTPVATIENIMGVAAGISVERLACLASDIRAGMSVITDVGNGPEWSELTYAGCVGMRRVARLYCGGRNFAAGVRPGKYIYTHNANQEQVK